MKAFSKRIWTFFLNFWRTIIIMIRVRRTKCTWVELDPLPSDQEIGD